MSINRDLAVRLEVFESFNQVEYAWAYNNLHGEGAVYSTIGSGIAIFAGVGSPLSQAFALGMRGEVHPSELDELEEFFRSRGASVEIEVCEYADPSLVRLLEKRGYQITERSNVLLKELGEDDEDETFANRVEMIREEDLDGFARVVASAFAEGEEPTGELVDIFRVFFRQGNATCFGVMVDEIPAGAGTVLIQQHVAELGGAATLPQYRGRGIQGDLLKARCAYGRSRGCTQAMVTTAPGTISQRNAERHGFQVAYSRTKYSRFWN
jgi:GNAT superfamily N-acetyltransferase